MRSLAVDRSLESIAGPLVAQNSTPGKTVPAPLDPLSDRTLLGVVQDRSQLTSYLMLAQNGIDYKDGRLQLRTSQQLTTIDSRFDGLNGDYNTTSAWISRGTDPSIQGSILDLKNKTIVSTHNGEINPLKRDIINPGEGITTQTLAIPSTGITIWAGLYPRALSSQEIFLVSKYLAARFLPVI